MDWHKGLTDLSHSGHSKAHAASLFPAGVTLIVYLIVLSFVLLFILGVYGQILVRAGFSRWWSLVLLVPGLGIFATALFAMIAWPVEKKKGRARVRQAA